MISTSHLLDMLFLSKTPINHQFNDQRKCQAKSYDRFMTELRWPTWLWVWPTKVKYRNTKVPNLKMLLNLLLNSAVSLDRPASLALMVLLNVTWKVKSLRAKVKFCEEVGHLNKVWSVMVKNLINIIQLGEIFFTLLIYSLGISRGILYAGFYSQ